jgi:alcohol dehydrogenase class IV
MNFEFAAPGRLVFGPGQAARLPALVAALGRRVFFVVGANPARQAGLAEGLAGAELAVTTFSVAGEPSVDVAREGVRLAREAGCDVVLSVGGGGAIDAGKAVAALAANPGDPYDYLEVVGAGRTLAARPLPHVAVPTTAGTGAEATANAVLTAVAERVKVSLRSPMMLPSVALVDPELTVSMPPAVTAATGLDALTQLLEAFVSVKAGPLTDALCREGLRLAANCLAAAYDDGENRAAREGMALASLYGGLALANARLGAVHGFAAPIGGLFAAPHGQVCASLLPAVVAANIAALRAREPGSSRLAAYAEAAVLLTGRAGASPEDGADWLDGLCRRVHAPTLSALGLRPADIPLVVAKAARASSMQGNPIVLTEAELAAIVARALG